MQSCVLIYAQPPNKPLNFTFQTPGVDGCRSDNPDAFFLKLLRDNERLKIPDFRTTGSCTDSSQSAISKLARFYQIARLVLFVAHQTMRVK